MEKKIRTNFTTTLNDSETSVRIMGDQRWMTAQRTCFRYRKLEKYAAAGLGTDPCNCYQYLAEPGRSLPTALRPLKVN